MNKPRLETEQELEARIHHMIFVGDKTNGTTGLLNGRDPDIAPLAEAFGAFLKYSELVGKPFRHFIDK